jgi:steroid 5-alpha reductase family enzyme
MIAAIPWMIATAVLVMTTLWAIQLRTRDAATADVGWAFLVAGGVAAAAALTDGDLQRRLLVGGMAMAWALRLGFFLLRDRVLRAEHEDGRYAALREHWGAKAPRNFLGFYLAQAAVAGLFVVPIAAAMRGGPLSWPALVAIAIWLVSLIGESVADQQLARFRARPEHRGQVCRDGLWRYSRHPNYFFEWLHWWAYVVVAEGALLTFLGPLIMLIFLFQLTGIPYTERQAIKSRGDRYRAYQRTTSVFFPWPPRPEAN